MSVLTNVSLLAEIFAREINSSVCEFAEGILHGTSINAIYFTFSLHVKKKKKKKPYTILWTCPHQHMYNIYNKMRSVCFFFFSLKSTLLFNRKNSLVELTLQVAINSALAPSVRETGRGYIHLISVNINEKEDWDARVIE